ncbi:TetR/AcrR family transcriptional regulator [Providencia vermicola]|uniref:TetR/AcrR family transcriptional regulator n=1 Tax=Providencia vermicola TaxID=333965 RepID=UPI002200A504|nr:TetR/AcrR family transcriptional regulator [Providencia stuartii]
MEISVKSLRTGGRSAKIQQAVYSAVNKLLEECDPSTLSVYTIASEAGVPASTIYRRWGDLNRLLADVAVQKLHPDTIPNDMGNYKADITEWVEQYYEEMSSPTGMNMLREIIYAKEGYAAKKCTVIIGEQLDIINARAQNRSEQIIPNELLINFVVSPIIFHLLFDNETLTCEKALSFLNRLFLDTVKANSSDKTS